MYGAVHNATVPVELKNVQYAGLLDPGTYNVSVKMSDKAKECITSMRVFGNEGDLTDDCYTDEGCTRVLHPVTEPEIEFQFSSDPECMRDMSVYITIVPVTTDETKLDDKMAFQIGLRPLTVTFEDLVRIVTYPNYRNIEDSGSLRDEVLKLIALDVQNMIPDWKSVVLPEDGKVGEFQIKIVGTTLHLEHIPKNGNEPDWWIEFPHGISVWVKDAEDVKEKISERCDIPPDVLDNFAGTDLITRCAYVCDPIKETIDETYGSKAYNNYLLTVKFGGSECEGLSGYGVANYSRVRTAITNPAIPASYIATCIAGQGVCMAIKVGSIVGAGSAFLDGVLGGTHCIVEGAIMGALQYISANYGESWIGTSGEAALPTEIAYLFAAGPVAQTTGKTTIPVYRPGRIANRLLALKDAKIKYNAITSNLRDAATFQTLKSDTEEMVSRLTAAGVKIPDNELRQVEQYAGKLENLGAEKTRIVEQLQRTTDKTKREQLLSKLDDIEEQIKEVRTKYQEAMKPIVKKLQDAEEKLKKAQTTCTAVGSTTGAVFASLTAAASYATLPENILKANISTCNICMIQVGTEKTCVTREGETC